MTQRKGFGGMGASSILMIFVVLCLTTFSVLSLVSARADMRLTRKQQQAVESYYAADAQADVLLREIDEALLMARADTARYAQGETTEFDLSADMEIQAAYEQLTARRLAQLDILEQSDSRSAVFVLPAGEDRQLRTQVEILPLTDAVRYRVVSRRVENKAGEWDDGDDWNLWTGE